MFDTHVKTGTSDGIDVGCSLERRCYITISPEKIISIECSGRELTILTDNYEIKVNCRGVCDNLCNGSTGTNDTPDHQEEPKCSDCI